MRNTPEEIDAMTAINKPTAEERTRRLAADPKMRTRSEWYFFGYNLAPIHKPTALRLPPAPQPSIYLRPAHNRSPSSEALHRVLGRRRQNGTQWRRKNRKAWRTEAHNVILCCQDTAHARLRFSPSAVPRRCYRRSNQCHHCPTGQTS